MVSRELVELLMQHNALIFGEFITKSGRKSPYFVNMGKIHSGTGVSRLASYYAEKIIKLKEEGTISEEIKCIYGPAYKGIPLAVATSIELARIYGWDIPFSFNRKESKDHGEGGDFVGYDIKPGDSILIIEDVITAGTAVRESLDLLAKRGSVKVEGVLVCLDRMEKGLTHLSATQELRLKHNTPVYSLVCLQELNHILREAEMEGMPLVARENRMAMEDYLLKYGVSDSELPVIS